MTRSGSNEQNCIFMPDQLLSSLFFFHIYEEKRVAFNSDFMAICSLEMPQGVDESTNCRHKVLDESLSRSRHFINPRQIQTKKVGWQSVRHLLGTPKLPEKPSSLYREYLAFLFFLLLLAVLPFLVRLRIRFRNIVLNIMHSSFCSPNLPLLIGHSGDCILTGGSFVDGNKATELALQNELDKVPYTRWDATLSII